MNALIGGDLKEVLQALGHPIGSSFDFTFIDGNRTYLRLADQGVEVTSSCDIEEHCAFGIVIQWILADFAKRHDLGEFSTPTPESELVQVADFYKNVMMKPEYATMPLKVLIPRISSDMTTFWKYFKAGSAGELRSELRSEKVPNYMKKVLQMVSDGKMPVSGIHNVSILHDDWCNTQRGRGICNCNPDIVVPN